MARTSLPSSASSLRSFPPAPRVSFLFLFVRRLSRAYAQAYVGPRDSFSIRSASRAAPGEERSFFSSLLARINLSSPLATHAFFSVGRTCTRARTHSRSWLLSSKSLVARHYAQREGNNGETYPSRCAFVTDMVGEDMEKGKKVERTRTARRNRDSLC